MPTPDTLAAQFARCVESLRTSAAKEEQKAEFRALLALLEKDGLALREEQGRVTVNGAPVDRLSVASLLPRLTLHDVTGFTVPRDPVPAEVFELVRALAEEPGDAAVDAKLESGVGRVSVIHLGSPPPPTSLGTEGILRGDPMTDIASPRVQVPGALFITHDATLPPEDALPAEGRVKASKALPGMGEPPPAAPAAPIAHPPPPPAAPAPTQPSSPAFAPAIARSQTTATLLQELEQAPEAPNVGEVLSVLGRQVEDAVHHDRTEQALTIAVTLVRLELRVPEGGARRQYGIALRRMYSKPLLKVLAGLLAVPKHEADAVLALQRAGLDAVEVLIDRLIAAPGVGERRALFDTLRQMHAGHEQLIPLLRNSKWLVVRNVAELIGELGMEEAVPHLAQALGHEDERVRKVVALALAKIGSPNTAEPLRRALKDPSPEVRMQVAVGVGGRRTMGAVMSLVSALEGEEDENVRRELILALGRIGTPEAVQSLIKIAQPSGRLFSRKPVGLRLAAVEALRLAGTAPALGTLEGLSEDSDKQVRAAAETAVKELTRRPQRGSSGASKP
jgi:HEAT repeat protein